MAQPPGVLLLALRPFCLWAVQSSDSKVRINPSSSDGQASGKYNQWLLRPSLRSSEDQWTLVRQRHWRRKDLHSRRVRKPVGKTTFRAEARFKAQLLGRCFRCLAKDHRRAHCREPIKCLRCKTNGHIARNCPSRSSVNKPFTRLSTPSAAAVPALPGAKACMEDHPIGHASSRPYEGFCAITVSQDMEEDLQRLRSLMIVVKVVGPR